MPVYYHIPYFLFPNSCRFSLTFDLLFPYSCRFCLTFRILSFSSLSSFPGPSCPQTPIIAFRHLPQSRILYRKPVPAWSLSGHMPHFPFLSLPLRTSCSPSVISPPPFPSFSLLSPFDSFTSNVSVICSTHASRPGFHVCVSLVLKLPRW